MGGWGLEELRRRNHSGIGCPSVDSGAVFETRECGQSRSVMAISNHQQPKEVPRIEGIRGLRLTGER